MRLGEFGAAQRELSGERDDFVFCGEVFVVEQPIPAVLMLHLGAAMGAGSVEEIHGMGVLFDALRLSLTKPPRTDTDGSEVPADDEPFQRLYRLAVDQAVELEPLMRLVMALFEAQSGRPTRQPSVSSAGPVTTSPSSSVSAIPAAPSHLRSVDSLIRGDSNTIEVDVDPGLVRMGDGTLVQFTPTERTG